MSMFWGRVLAPRDAPLPDGRDFQTEDFPDSSSAARAGFELRERCRRYSISPGTSEMNTIAMITIEKFLFTSGMFPNQ